MSKATALSSTLVECPDAETLAQLASDRGDPTVRGAIADHASTCASCHAVLQVVLGFEPAARHVLIDTS